MNILFIGNGFDRAHNGKRQILYSDFVEWMKNEKKRSKYAQLFFEKELDDNLKMDSDYWSSFEDIMFIIARDKMKESNKLQFYNVVNNFFNEWFSGLNISFEKNTSINKLILEIKPAYIISLNYTDTPKLYGYLPCDYKKGDGKKYMHPSNKFVRIHYINKKAIIGNDKENRCNKDYFVKAYSGEKFWSIKEFFTNTILSSFNLYFYGISFGSSDKDMFKVLSKKRKGRLVFYLWDDKIQKNNILKIFNRKTTRESKKMKFIKI